ncbi:MAG: acyl-CoA/acyl-ACP dehydrogenase [Alteromonadaceae bacterium]|nr:acyl-CoA/acyl-ACP dehydrogenase [Alteromonadaceae bacterium]
MEQSDQLILETAERIFSDHCSAEAVNSAEDGQFPDGLWRALQESGLLLVWAPETLDGMGGSTSLGLSLIRKSAGYALPVPLAGGLTANWLLAQADMASTEQSSSFALSMGTLPELEDGRLSGEVNAVAFASEVSQLVVPCLEARQLTMAIVAVEACDVRQGSSLAGEPRNTVVLDGTEPLTSSAVSEGVSLQMVRGFAALVRAHQIAGAMEHIVALTANYVQERNQFGRPLSRFQAIQHSVADIAAESALANAAIEQADRAVSQPSGELGDILVAIATAKSVAGEAAGKVAQLAHQAHGAMGFSHEYPLQQYSRRLWCWREEFGTEFYWNQWLGEYIALETRHQGSAWGSISRAF